MRNFFSFLILVLVPAFAFPQVVLSYSGSKSYSLVERTNLRRYENGRYVGLTSREVRSFINPTEGGVYDGNFYVVEKTLRDMQSAFAGIYDAIPSVFSISADGKMEMRVDNGYPSFRSFPSFPEKPVLPGESWRSQAERAVDPLNKGKFTRLKIDVVYRFSGEENYRGQDVYRIKAVWQTNYGMNWRDRNGDDELVKAGGGHSAEILVLKSNGSPILVIDDVDETFAYSDGRQVNFKGKINLFIEFPPAVDKGKILPALGEIATISDIFADDLSLDGKPPATNGNPEIAIGTIAPVGSEKSGQERADEKIRKNLEALEQIEKSRADEIARAEREKSEMPKKVGDDDVYEPLESVGEDTGKMRGKSDVAAKIAQSDSGGKNLKNNMVVEKTSAGIRLSIRNLQFKPDSSELVDSEKSRLDEIASVLSLVPGGKFLVEGHTARVGDESGEQELSEERAKIVARELSRRGVSADSFICRGWGGTKPVASNATAEGKAQNRRVEITILE